MEHDFIGLAIKTLQRPTDSEIATLCAENEQLRAQRDLVMLEVSSLATTMWKDNYQQESPNWDLCDSPEGICTQIDNMYAGLREDMHKLRADIEVLAGGVINYDNGSAWPTTSAVVIAHKYKGE